jgi:hypothetical protein
MGGPCRQVAGRDDVLAHHRSRRPCGRGGRGPGRRERNHPGIGPCSLAPGRGGERSGRSGYLRNSGQWTVAVLGSRSGGDRGGCPVRCALRNLYRFQRSGRYPGRSLGMAQPAAGCAAAGRARPGGHRIHGRPAAAARPRRGGADGLPASRGPGLEREGAGSHRRAGAYRRREPVGGADAGTRARFSAAPGVFGPGDRGAVRAGLPAGRPGRPTARGAAHPGAAGRRPLARALRPDRPTTAFP